MAWYYIQVKFGRIQNVFMKPCTHAYIYLTTLYYYVCTKK